MAGRIRCILLLTLATDRRHPLHSESRATPLAQDVSRGVFVAARQIRSSARRTLHFQFGRPQLMKTGFHAAPPGLDVRWGAAGYKHAAPRGAFTPFAAGPRPRWDNTPGRAAVNLAR